MKYKNIKTGKFNSKLEEYCWNLLEEEKILYYYEPFQIVISDNFEYLDSSWERIGKEFKSQRNRVNPIKYKPDFVSSPFIGEVTWIIETKGYFNPLARLKWKLLKRWIVNNNLHWKLFLPTNKKEVKQSIEILKNEY